MQKDEWICHPCPNDKFGRASNFSDRATCRKCGKNRPNFIPSQEQKKKEVTFKPGDWLCIKCNDHQFRDNKFCRKCNSSKPVGNGGDGSDCVVCFEKEKNTGFLHGLEVHVCCCRECANRLKTCPICRAEIDNKVTIYF